MNRFPDTAVLSIAAAALLAGATTLHGQTKLTEHTVSRDSSAAPVDVDVADLAWLAGHWQGEGFGGVVEEYWAPPLGGSMLGAFKLVLADTVEFQEIMNIRRDGAHGVSLVLKHFDADLKGWEEKNDVTRFEFVRMVGETAYFSGLTFERVSRDELRLYLAMRDEFGTKTEVVMNYYRVGTMPHARWKSTSK